MASPLLLIVRDGPEPSVCVCGGGGLTLSLGGIRDPFTDESACIIDDHGFIKLRGEGGEDGLRPLTRT